ncbi:MAG: hypothetical protein BWY68_00371 [bacterium ADurb.Bin400]|nr:MAG: hypothetical protein BWY68_00371 [bacterium ADurb.Bin400]
MVDSHARRAIADEFKEYAASVQGLNATIRFQIFSNMLKPPSGTETPISNLRGYLRDFEQYRSQFTSDKRQCDLAAEAIRGYLRQRESK